MMIDTHCHLSKDDYEDIDAVIKHMKDNIMIMMLLVGTPLDKYPAGAAILDMGCKQIIKVVPN